MSPPLDDRLASMDDEQDDAPFTMRTLSSDLGTRVLASGELDLGTAEQFVAALGSALAAGGTVTLDARDLTFLDSAGLRALDEVLREARRAGATFAVAPDLRPAVRRTLELSGMLAALPMLQQDGDAGR